jgi:hypothetical protein
MAPISTVQQQCEEDPSHATRLAAADAKHQRKPLPNAITTNGPGRGSVMTVMENLPLLMT